MKKASISTKLISALIILTFICSGNVYSLEYKDTLRKPIGSDALTRAAKAAGTVVPALASDQDIQLLKTAVDLILSRKGKFETIGFEAMKDSLSKINLSSISGELKELLRKLIDSIDWYNWAYKIARNRAMGINAGTETATGRSDDINRGILFAAEKINAVLTSAQGPALANSEAAFRGTSAAFLAMAATQEFIDPDTAYGLYTKIMKIARRNTLATLMGKVTIGKPSRPVTTGL